MVCRRRHKSENFIASPKDIYWNSPAPFRDVCMSIIKLKAPLRVAGRVFNDFLFLVFLNKWKTRRVATTTTESRTTASQQFCKNLKLIYYPRAPMWWKSKQVITLCSWTWKMPFSRINVNNFSRNCFSRRERRFCDISWKKKLKALMRLLIRNWGQLKPWLRWEGAKNGEPRL